MNPLSSALKTLQYALSGRMHFPKENIGKQVELDDGTWTIFREVIIDPTPNQPQKPGAVFRPRFTVSGMSLEKNIRFSVFPIPFFTGLPGFRHKLWLVNPQTGEFSGFYEWDTEQDALNYKNSFAAGFMTRRSVPGSVSFRVLPPLQSSPEIH